MALPAEEHWDPAWIGAEALERINDPQRLTSVRRLRLREIVSQSLWDRWLRLALGSLEPDAVGVALLGAGAPAVHGWMGAAFTTDLRELERLWLLSTLSPEVVAVADLRAEVGAVSVEAARLPGAFIGLAIHDEEGRPVGCLSAVWSRRRDWVRRDRDTLRALATGLEADLAREMARVARREAEAMALRNDAKFRAVFENTALGIGLITPDGEMLRANRALEAMLGATATELRMRRLTEFLDEGEAAAVRSPIRDVATGASEFYEDEHHFRSTSGRAFWGHVIVSPVRLLRSETVGGLLLIQDVTERHEAEAALHESQKQLLLSQRLEAVGRLAGGIAHDFNNMLTVISSFAQLLSFEQSLNEEAASYVDEIQHAAARSAELTRQLLAFSRQQVLKPQRLDLNLVVSGMRGMLQRVIGEDIDLITRTAEDLPAVLADPGQVEQVVMNLAVNARDAMPDGGKLTLRTFQAEVSAERAAAYPYTVKPGEYSVLSVADTGEGMSEEVLSRIFEPFFTTKDPGKGTGLGLSTAYGIVKQSGGYIWATSDAGSGSTFDIYLPALEGPAEWSEAMSRDRRRARGGDETILLVEDEPIIRRLGTRALSRYGYNVLSAEGGGEALEIFQKHAAEISLLLVDVVMPRMSGEELADEILCRRPDLPVLFISGYAAEAVRERVASQPLVFFLSKPFDPDSLARTVRDVLDGRSG